MSEEFRIAPQPETIVSITDDGYLVIEQIDEHGEKSSVRFNKSAVKELFAYLDVLRDCDDFDPLEPKQQEPKPKKGDKK